MCIFHDKNYLQDKANYEERKGSVINELKHYVNHCVSSNDPILCIGFYLPHFSLSDLDIGKEFPGSLFFTSCQFLGETSFMGAVFKEADFSGATFKEEVSFSGATFKEEVSFSGASFKELAYFDNATFQDEANFGAAVFKDNATFSDVTFRAEANFYNVTFKLGYFTGAKFQNAVFAGASFTEANFSWVTFQKTEFNEVSFQEADFSKAVFNEITYFNRVDFKIANFSDVTFRAEANFLNNNYSMEVFFNRVLFEQPNKVMFNGSNLSKVSFGDSDITRIRFGDKITWEDKNDDFIILEEQWLQQKSMGKESSMDVSLELVSSVYRNLRENYEFRLRYDEAGKLFTKEMELKRKYRTIRKKNGKGFEVKENNWFRMHFSLTGLYYHFSTYGESIAKPTLIGVISVGLSTIFWLTQSSPGLEPHFQYIDNSTSHFIGISQSGNLTQWLKSFERSFADFLPLLPLGGNIKVGVIDYIIKIVGGALTFGLLIIAFRRKFERKYTR